MKITAYHTEMSARWDQFVSESPHGTPFHTRKFIGYHGERFADVSTLIESSTGKLLGVFPAAETAELECRVVESHPGLSFAGIVGGPALVGPRMIEAMGLLLEHYRAEGFGELRYRAVPQVYRLDRAEDDRYALHHHGARRARVHLSCVQELRQGMLSKKRRWQLNRIKQAQIAIEDGLTWLEPVWNLANEQLLRRFGATIVHSVRDFRFLNDCLPGIVRVIAAHREADVLAGAIVFDLGHILRLVNLGATKQGQTLGALDCVLSTVTQLGLSEGKLIFDLGTSNATPDEVLSAPLFEFKRKFGNAAGVIQETFSISL